MTHKQLLNNTLLMTIFGGCFSFFTACTDSGQTVEENITRVELHITGPNVDKKFSWNDTNGDGVADAVDSIVLPPLTGNLKCEIGVFDGTVTPETVLTTEIAEESNDHLFKFDITNANGLIISGLSNDAAGNPFGLSSVWETGQPSTGGNVRVRLFHEPTDKNNATNPGGDVDFDVAFPVVIR